MNDLLENTLLQGIIWDSFSKSVDFYKEKANDFILSQYIKLQLQESDIEYKNIDLIEKIILDVPRYIKDEQDINKQKEAFYSYLNSSSSRNIINNGKVYGVQSIERGSKVTQNFNFGETNTSNNIPKS